MKNPYDYYQIQAHRQDKHHDGVYRVTHRSPRLWHLVAKFDTYLKREMHYDFLLFDENRDGEGYAAYLFGYGGVWVGACCFRDTSHACIPTPVEYLLNWVWLHPFVRREGLLTKAWPQFEQEHGKFLILAPLSHGMQCFVDEIGVAQERVIFLGSASDSEL